MVLTLTTSAYIQTSQEGTPAVFLATDPNWINATDLQEGGNLAYNISGINFIVNEISNKTGFIEKPAIFLDDNDNLLSNITLGNPDVVSGNKYLIRLRYKFVHRLNGTIKYGETQNVSVFITSPPVTPTNISSTIRAEDSGISINISSLYTYNSPSDGYDAITKIRYYVSKVGSDASGDLLIGDLDITFKDGIPEYNEWHTIPNLLNGVKYEVAYRLTNSIADSALSETVTITPSDLPSEITHLTARNNFNDLISPMTSASTSIISFYWSKPADYDSLKSASTNKPVTKYTIKKQEVAWNDEDKVYEFVGDADVTELLHDVNATTRPNYQLDNKVGDFDASYDYVYSYQQTESDFGKIFQFSVFASNSNGNGPESELSNKIASYINPSLQEFELVNQTILKPTIGTPISVHNGVLNLTLTTLSSLNGMKDFITDVDVSDNNIYKTNGTDIFKSRSVEMRLVVTSTDTIPTLVFDGSVNFLQQYSEEVQTFTINGTQTTRTVGTLLDEWLIEDIAGSLPGFGNLVLGKKYKYTLFRLAKDPLDEVTTLSSIPTEVLRTHFQSPSAISQIQAYAFNDDFTPVLVDGLPGIRVLFTQITDASMNGTDVFISESNKLEYEIRSNSQIVDGVQRLQHSDTENIRQFEIKSSLGVVNNLYVRVYIKNPELDIVIEGNESSPAVQESAKTYPSAVTDLNSVVDASGTSVNISWTKQTLSGLGGFNSVNVINRVYLYNDSSAGTPFQSIDVSYSSTQTVSFNNLVLGDIYKIYILSLGRYSKLSLDGLTQKFDFSEIRQNYAKSAITAVGTPGKPTNVEVYPGADKVTFNYDPVSDSELRGNNPDNFMYHFILNTDSTYFPFQDEDMTLVQASVANVAGSDEAVVTKGYTNVLQSNNRTNAVDLISEQLYRYALYIVANIGNEDIVNVEDVLSSQNGTALTLVPVDKTPEKALNGELYYNNNYLLINNNVPTPEITATAGEGQITVSIKKPIVPPNELVIVLDNNDALDMDGNVIPIFSTINVREAYSETGSGGLFTLENANLSNPIGGVDYGTNGYDFRVVTQSGGSTYFVTIDNLVNGRTHNVQVRFANTFNGYDFYGEVASLSIAAEAPPTAPEKPTFDVDSKVINLRWEPPLNSGGAGLSDNSALLFEVTVKNGSNQVLQISNISDTFLTLNTSNFATISNGTTYSVEIIAYYIKGGNDVKSAAAIIPAVRPNVAPLSPSVVVTRGENKLNVAITTVTSTQSSLYPLSSLAILYKRSSDTTYTTSKTFGTDDNINDGSTSLTHSIINLLNGESYDVKIMSVPNYTYAQQPSDVLRVNQIPFGSPDVLTSIATRPTGNQKALDLQVNLNGSGDITQIIALGKSANSTTIGILNLSSDKLPTITRSGLEGETPGVAGNQKASFRLDFASTIPSNLNDAIIIVNTTNGSDAGAYSASSIGSQYFVDGLASSG